MKTYKSLFAASALAIAFASSANAANSLSTANAPSTVSAGGTIEKYINFTKTDNAISMGNLGGPTATGTFESTVAAGTDGAEITWDANTHISVTVKNGAILTSDNTAQNVEIDTLPTQFRTQVRGRKVSRGGSTVSQTAVPTIPSTYSDLAFSAAGAENIYSFEHGPASGLKLDVEATRNGVDDHYGQYNTTINLTFSDLN